MRAAARTERRLFALAAAATAAAWIYTVRSAGSMSSGMPMPGDWSMSMVWMAMGGQSPVAHAVMFVTMWTAMMIAMMLPSVLPSVLLHRRLIASRIERRDPPAGSDALLLAGYFSVWALFGLLAYTIGMTASAAAMRHEAVSRQVPIAIGVMLVAAGVYQLTRWKLVCLRHCRSPIEFFSHHSIRTGTDSWSFGVHHGAYCAACCWGLMAIQLVLGVMNIPLMIGVAIVIALEKQWRHGERLARVAGVAAIVGGLVVIARSAMG